MFDSAHSLMYVRALDWTPHGWGLVKWYAPDVGAIALVLTLMVAVIRARRILHHPQSSAACYCRQCNYEVTESFVGRCPECGHDCGRDRPRRGQATRRRLAFLLVPCFATAALCGAGLLWGLRKYESGGPFMSRPWPTIYMGYLGRGWLFAKPIVAGGPGTCEWRTNRYLRYRLPGGEQAGPELPFTSGDNYGNILSSDGCWMGTSTNESGRLELVVCNTQTGAVKRQTLTTEGAPNGFQVAVAAGADRRYIRTEGRFADGDAEITPRLFEIDMAAPEGSMVQQLAAVPVPTSPSTAGPGGQVAPHIEFVVLREGGQTHWCLLSFIYNGTGGSVEPPSLISPAASGELRAVRISAPILAGWHSRLINGGAILELEDNNTWTTYQVDVASGNAVQTCGLHREVMHRSDNGVCFYTDDKGQLQAAMDGQAPFATLKAPPGMSIPSSISGDGRWAAALVLGHDRPFLCPNCVPATRAQEILVWDLASVLPGVASPAPPTPTP